MIHRVLKRSAATLGTLVLVAFGAIAVPQVTSTANAQIPSAPFQSEQGGGAALVTDPNEYLKEQLVLYIRPRLPEEQAFIDYVVLQVKLKHLPVRIANQAMLYARVKQPYPFPYFKMAVLQLAKREDIKLAHLPPSTTTPNALPR